MSSLKSIAVVVCLGALSIAVYWKMNDGPEPEPPAGFAGAWGTPPTIEMPSGAPTGPDGGIEVGTNGIPSTPHGMGAPPLAAAAPPWGDPPVAPDSAAPPSWDQVAVGGSSAASPAVEQGFPFGANAIGTPDAAVGTTLPAGSPVATGPGPALGQAPAPRADSAATDAAVREARQTTYREARSLAQEALDRAALGEALLLLSPWCSDPALAEEDRQSLDQLLGQLAGTVIYSTDYHTEPPYTVQAGESLQTIADAYQVPDVLLARINGLDVATPLQPGQQLKVVRGPFAAAISLENREMILNVGGYYAGRFTVGVGSERQDIEGTWLVRHKLANPTYYGRDRVIDADDPSNPLGEYWLGLASATTEATVIPFGIHGSSDPESIHRDDPRGYIRLTPDDARDIYEILSIGSKVVVRR